jgi:hypothetical protein
MTGCSKPLHTGPIPQDAESGTVTPGKESWKKRYLVATSDGQPTLTWYKNEKSGLAGSKPQGMIQVPDRAYDFRCNSDEVLTGPGCSSSRWRPARS